eukprot:CAMPEP_0198671374 /NCGR_PEP_ID=MMETSP1467-20131203/85884_1 /TAXON_ID=1462469 /ORGANISM="unid. sp., Strain CCMP2135" /LENGTH=80 /DNA_ID=CAMNT_0044408175 /DNA_START=64 /DNA_END=306 /DNA_ORIENTATION=+
MTGKLVAEVVKNSATFQISNPATTIHFLDTTSAARPANSPATQNVAENPYPVSTPYCANDRCAAARIDACPPFEGSTAAR